MIKEFANGHSLLIQNWTHQTRVSGYYMHVNIHPHICTDIHANIHVYMQKSRNCLIWKRAFFL